MRSASRGIRVPSVSMSVMDSSTHWVSWHEKAWPCAAEFNKQQNKKFSCCLIIGNKQFTMVFLKK